jgi:hypothetical protein
LPALSQIDPGTTDLSAIRIALVLPRGLRPRANGVALDVVIQQDSTAASKTSFKLVPVDIAADAVKPPAPVQGDALFAYRLAPDEVVRFQALRAGLLRSNSHGGHGSLSMGIATREFCSEGAVPAGPVLSSSYLMTSETGSYVAVTSGFDLRSDETITAALARLSPC